MTSSVPHRRLRRLIDRAGRLLSSCTTPFDRADRKAGALLIGYIDATLGLGQSVRGLAAALETVGADFAIYPFTAGVETRRGATFMAEHYDTRMPRQVNVLEVACDQLPVVFRRISTRFFRRSVNVLRPYWELSRAPQAWRPYLADIDEIWAPSQFVAEAFASIFSGPIILIPPAITVEAPSSKTRADFGLVPDRFYFLFTFDYYSYASRKNPLAVLDAFRKAFANDDDAGLIVKSIGEPGRAPALHRAVKAAADADPRITLIEQTLSRADIIALTALSDCYVSLHRSEGFGLGMAEAMALGTSVIGTDYSGNRDFLSAGTGYPVAYTLRPVAPSEYPWSEGQHWAEPDEGAAIAAMRAVRQGRTEAERRAQAAAKLMRERFGLAAVGAAAARRIEELAAGQSAKS